MKNKVSNFLIRTTALALLATPFYAVSGQEVYSATIGAVAMKVPGQSDVMVALPFKKEKAGGGTVSTVDGSIATLGASSLTAGELDATGDVASHYLYVETGALMGRHFDIESNTASSVTLDASDLTGLAGADVSIREHWTLGTLFPEGVGYVEELEAGLREIEVIMPDFASVGGGIAASRIFYYYSSAWREVGKPLTEAVDAVVVEPGASFVVRNNGSSDLDYFFFGEVEYGPLAIPLVSASDVVDNFVAVERPLGLTVSDLQLHSSPAFDAANDRLLVYPMTDGINKTPTVYMYSGGTWQVEGGNGGDVGSTLIEAGQGIAVRKAADSDGTDYWVNEWSISQ